MAIKKFLRKNDDGSIDVRNISVPEPPPLRPYETVLILGFEEDYKPPNRKHPKLKELESFLKTLTECVNLVPFKDGKKEWEGYCSQQSHLKEKWLRIACWSRKSCYRLHSPANQSSKIMHYALDDFARPKNIKLRWISNLEELKNLLLPEQGLLHGSEPLPVRRDF